jgi:hypothetical protein
LEIPMSAFTTARVTMTASIWHNESSLFAEYTPGDVMSHRGSVTFTVFADADITTVFEAAYAASNFGSGVEDRAYFGDGTGNRSTAVGDVIHVDADDVVCRGGEIASVARFGFTRFGFTPVATDA